MDVAEPIVRSLAICVSVHGCGNSRVTPDGRAPVATGTALSALDPAFRDRPHEALDDLRQREPVHQDRMFDRVVLTRASDVRAVLNDRQMASDPRKSRPGSFSRLLIGAEAEFRPTMLHLDDPDHRRLRGLVAKAFNQRSVDAMRPSITATAEALVEVAARHDAFDGDDPTSLLPAAK